MIVVLLCMPWMGLGPEGNARWTNGLYEAVDKRALRSCLYPGFLSAYRIHRRRKQRKGKHLGKHQ